MERWIDEGGLVPFEAAAVPRDDPQGSRPRALPPPRKRAAKDAHLHAGSATGFER
jgi:hypothetical protein